MLRRTYTVLATSLVSAALVGCQANGDFNPLAGKAEETPTELAAYSARAEYPATRPSESIHSAAIVSKDKETIKVYNFTSKPIGEAKVWVNRSFVFRIPGIAPQSKVVIKTDQLYNGLGNTFASQKADVSSVQVQTADGLYSVDGPAME